MNKTDNPDKRDTQDTQRRLFAYLKPHWKTTVVGLLCAVIASTIPGAVSGFIKKTIDAMNSGNVENLRFICVIVILVFIIKGIFGFGQSYLLALTANRIAATIREDIFAHLNKLSLSYFNRRRTGAIMSTLTNDVPVLQNAAMSLRDLVSAPISIVVSLSILFYLSWWLTLISLIFIPFMALVVSRISKRIRRISAAVQDKLADITNVIEETVAGVRIIKSFAAEEHVNQRFVRENRLTLKTVMHGIMRAAQLRPILEVIGAGGIAIVLLLGGQAVATNNNYQLERDFRIQEAGYKIIQNAPNERKYREEYPAGLTSQKAYEYKLNRQEEMRKLGEKSLPPEWQPELSSWGMTGGGLIAFLYLLNTVARAAGDIGGIAAMRAQALAAGKRIFEEVLDIEPEVKEKLEPDVMGTLEGHICFENVSFQYGTDMPPVLHDISFEVRPGEVVALVGRSGSGKSTLVDLIPRFYDPTEGRILIDGVDIRDVKLDSLRRQIGIVPQETWLFAGTLRDNIAYGNRDATDEEIKTAAYDANADFINGMSNKLDTVVSERGIRLSGGERQRIAIARAILLKPRLLILDEATSSLDASSEELVQQALDRMMKGRTTIVIAHRLSTIINADRILAMQDGRIVEMGSHRELIAAGGYYARLYETQLRGFD